MSEPTTVLLVDDHALVRQGVRAFLETQSDIAVVAEAGSGEEAVRMAAEHAPDVALVDLIMPGMDGVEATRRLKARSPRTNVVVLTSYHDDEHVFPAIQAGALSYILKEVGIKVSWKKEPWVVKDSEGEKRPIKRTRWTIEAPRWS